MVEMLFRCNILALVGGGTHPKFPQNKVLLWDDNQQKCIGELSYKSPVKNVKLRKDKIIVVLEERIYVYNFSDLRLVDAIDTHTNPKGLCSVSADNVPILACLDKNTKGSVKLINYDTNKITIVNAHNSGISCMSLNFTGSLLATASDKGTIIKIFSTADPTVIQEVRRGSDKAIIHSLSFDRYSNWMACTSDRETVHIFAMQKDKLKITDENEEEKKVGGAAKNKKHA